MKKKSRLRLMFDAISDRNLYGRSFFFRSFLFLIFGLIMQYYFHYLLNPQLLIIYIPFYVGLFLLSALFAKNFKIEFHPMPWWLAYLLLYTSVFSKAFAYVAPFENTLIGFLKRLLVMMISEPAFLVSLITIVVLGQRISLRENVGLDDKFFDKEKNRWKSEVEGFADFDKVLESLDGGRFVAGLFDKGLFNLTILWSCNVMEEVIDAITDGIIHRNPEKRTLFRKKSGSRLYYPLQLINLEYDLHQRCHGLWGVRNKIAHRNYKPTFDETKEAMTILTLFTQETPAILQKWTSF